MLGPSRSLLPFLIMFNFYYQHHFFGYYGVLALSMGSEETAGGGST